MASDPWMIEGRAAIDSWLQWAQGNPSGAGLSPVAALEQASLNTATIRKTRRAEWLNQLGSGQVRPEQAMIDLDSMRWFDGAFYHAWRLADSLWNAAEIGSAEGL